MRKLTVVVLALVVSACTPYPPPKLKENAPFYYNQGVAQYQKGDYDKAIQDYTKAIELNPLYADAYYNRGIAYDDKGYYDRAIEDYTEAIEIDPQYADAHVNRGIAYGKKGEYDRAISDFNEAIKTNPNGANAYYNRGLAYNKKGRYDKSISDYNKAIEVKPGYSSAYNSLAWILATCVDERYRDGREAIELSKQALESNSNPLYMDTLAAAYAEVGEYEDAVRTQEEVLALLREKGDPHNLFGEASRRLEFYRAGKPWREK